MVEKYKQEVFEKARYFLCFEDFIVHRLEWNRLLVFLARTMMFEVKKKSGQRNFLGGN